MIIFIKVILILLMAFILFSLGSALYFLIHDKANSDRVVKALTWRIGLSLLAFVLIFVAFAMGWLTPNQI